MPNVAKRTSYQEGTIERVSRAKGPDVWVYRWREGTSDGSRVQRKRVIGTIDKLKTLADAKRASDNLRLAVNANGLVPVDLIKPNTFGVAWGHFQLHELSDPDVDRSPSTIQVYEENLRRHILPRWRDVPLQEVRPVAVETWLRSLKTFAPATKAKFRNQMSCIFSHAIRHELFSPREGVNPIKAVRQGSKRVATPDILTLAEIHAIIKGIVPPPIKLMVIVAATTALRRSEVRGLKWEDLDLENCWINLKRGAVRKWTTKMKTEASRKGIPMMPQLAEAFVRWREETPYPQNEDWVFASPFTKGKRAYYGESAMADHVLPAVRDAGITKRVGWHTFRRSLACMMGAKKEDVKVVQELLRHSSSRLTLDIYQQGEEAAKRAAITHSSSLFA
jgi:integrase